MLDHSPSWDLHRSENGHQTHRKHAMMSWYLFPLALLCLRSWYTTVSWASWSLHVHLVITILCAHHGSFLVHVFIWFMWLQCSLDGIFKLLCYLQNFAVCFCWHQEFSFRHCDSLLQEQGHYPVVSIPQHMRIYHGQIKICWESTRTYLCEVLAPDPESAGTFLLKLHEMMTKFAIR